MLNKGEVWFVEFPLEEDCAQTINRPVSFIYKIGDLHQDDLRRIEEMYQKYLEESD